MAPRRAAKSIQIEGPETGQSTVEFSLTLIVFMLFLMIFFDFGRGIYAYSVVALAAQEGARFAVVNPSDGSGIASAARQRAVGLEPEQIQVTWQAIGASAMEVQVRYTFQPLTPLIAEAIGGGGGIPLSSTARMCRGVCLPG